MLVGLLEDDFGIIEIAELFRKGKPTSGLEFLCIIEETSVNRKY